MSNHRLFSSNSSDNSTPISTKGIEIHGWKISSTRGTIASSNKIDSITNHLNIPLPEMPFPNNHLTIKHQKSGFTYTLDGNRALASVEGVRKENQLKGLDLREFNHNNKSGNAKGKGLGEKPKSKGIKVAYANQWGKSRDAFGTAAPPTSTSSSTSQPPSTTITPPSSTNPDPSTFPPSSSSHFGPQVALAAAQSGITSSRHYDWTYSNTWPGLQGVESTLDTDLVQQERKEKEKEDDDDDDWMRFQKGDFKKDRIPTERLIPGPNAEPILFYDDLVLFEDELADNGSSVLRVKVRVMPSCFLILQRFFLRVDEVLFRIFDTRIWVDFQPEGTLPQASIPTQLPTYISPSTSSSSGGSTAAPWTRSGASINSLNQGLGGLSLGQTRKEIKSQSTTSTLPNSEKVLKEERRNESSDVDEKKVGETKIIRECSGFQASYSEVKAHLPPWKAQDLSPLTEENWVFQTLKKISTEKLKKKFIRDSNSNSGTQIGDSSYNKLLEEISPARLPLQNGNGNEGEYIQSNRILGQIDDESKEKKGDGEIEEEEEEDLEWEGCGERVDFVILKV